MAIKLARAGGATAIGITVGFAGSASPTVPSATNLAAAEQVAAQFVVGFASFSYRDPRARADVAVLATGHLAAVLSSPSQGSVGPALVAEKFIAAAHVVGFEVESDTPTSVALLARTDIRISTTSGSSSTIRLMPVSLAFLSADWKVSAVDGLTVMPSTPALGGPSAGSSPTTPGSGSPTDTPTTTTTGVGDTPGSAAAPPVTAVGDAPAVYVGWMKAAVVAQCPSLPWTVLAGMAKVESNFGRSRLPGVSSGSNAMGAQGPMQFEPATFAVYGTVAPAGSDPASPYDPADAVYSAAHLLCADGGGNPAHLYAAIFDYNHSDAYVSLVLAYANEYSQMESGGTSGERGLGSVIVAEAETYLGTPYVWGGENPRSGFDCSGLVQWVYAEAGLSLPRVAQDQYDAGPHLAADAPLYPGDLVFFGSDPSAVEHVGIYVGHGAMIDAPYTGALVRFDRVASVSLGLVGATRPEIPDLTGGAGVPVIGADVGPSGTADGSGHAGAEPGRGPGDPSTDRSSRHGIDQSTGLSHPGRHHPTTIPSTTGPGPTTLRTGRRHVLPTTTTTTTDPVTGSTLPGAGSGSGRHRPPTTTTTTTTETPSTTALTSPTSTPSSDDSDSTTTVPATVSSSKGTTTTSRPGHRRQKSG